MADNQVAISRMTRATSTSLSKATRQNVPPFLQKLYEMVSDSATDNLIRWSENGDSFFVLDHERVAHDVLPRWFKHSNFASFVRQLNMYGFHKIPHLQQGVLKSESETEIWNFEHPNFRRGQPDLLCLITRKKQAAERQNEDMSLGEKDGSGTPGLVGGYTPGSLVDINSIINGITAIKRHQATISADLNDLKASNQHLWQEALDARERHQKQQDTINRILKFLAGVFGNAGAHKGNPVHGSPHAGIPRKRQRLMIEGAAQLVKDQPQPLEPLDGVDPMVETASDEGTPRTRFVEVSPSPVPSKVVSVVTETPEPQNPTSPYESQAPMTADIVMGGNFTNQSPFMPFSNSFPPNSDNPAMAPSYPRPNDPTTTNPGALTSNSPGPREELLQSIINSPGSLQRLMNLLNFQQQQQNVPMPPPLDLNDPSKTDSSAYIDTNTFVPYVQQPYHPQPPPPPLSSSDPTLTMPPPPSDFDFADPSDPNTMSLLHTDEMFEPFIENAHRLKKTSDASSVITEHVDMMDANIESLIKHLGLDHTQLDNLRDEEYRGVSPTAAGGVVSGMEGDNEGMFNHDQVEQQQQQQPSQQQAPNRKSASTTSDRSSSDSSTSSASAGSNTGSTINPAVNATSLPYQPTIPEFDFSIFLDELAKQRGEATSGSGFGLGDYKPDANLDAIIDDNNNNHNNGHQGTAAAVAGGAGAGAGTANVNHKLEDPSTPPQLSAFVDEIASQSGESIVSHVSQSPPRTRAPGPTISDDVDASPTAVTVSLPDIASNNRRTGSTAPASPARKRKPDTDVDPPITGSPTGTRTQTKAKRKR